MAERPSRRVHYPSLGAFFTGLRERRGWNQSEAASYAARRNLKLTYQAIRGLEEGKTRHPDPEKLKSLATLYGVAYAEVVAEVVAQAYGLPLDAGDNKVMLRLETDDDVEDFVAVPLMRDRIAAGPPLIIDDLAVAGHLAFSRQWLERNSVSRPLCLRVGPSERSMVPTINPGDTLLLDCSDARRAEPKNDKIYAVNVDGGSTVKRLGVNAGGLTIIADNPDKENERYATRILPLEEGQTAFDVIVGQVVWKSEAI